MGPKRRKDTTQDTRQTEQGGNQKSTPKAKNETPSSGPKDDSRPGIPFKRIAIRFILVAGSLFAFNMYSKWNSENTFAGRQEDVKHRMITVPCSKDYEPEKSKYPGCLPKRCGRVVMDNVVDQKDAEHLLKMAKSGLSHGGSNGGASILDIHSGALSKGSQFINIYKIIETTKEAIFTEDDFRVYKKVKNNIHSTIAKEFGVPRSKLHLTSPTFFSRMTTKPAQTIHDEYWHTHVDKETYGSFHYTSLLYLSTYGVDFNGGRFVFVDDGRNTTVEPKIGRLSFFTSGSENPHFVEKVQSGIRYAITVSFTCDPDKAIPDPNTSRGQ